MLVYFSTFEIIRFILKKSAHFMFLIYQPPLFSGSIQKVFISYHVKNSYS